MAESTQRKRAHSTTHGLGRNIKDLFRGPSPRPPDTSASAQQSLSPAIIPQTIPALSTTVSPGPPAARRGIFGRALATISDLETALKGLQLGAKLCPPIASAAEGLLDCMDVMRETMKTADEFDELVDSLAQAVMDVEKHMQQATPVPQESEFVQATARELQKEVEYLRDKKNRRGRNRLVEATKDMEDLVKCRCRIKSIMLRLQSNTTLSVWWVVHKHLAHTLLEGMQPSKMAWYDSAMAAIVGRRACTPDTRIAILQGLRDWADDISSAKVYWINGMAGTGKTTISYTFCEELEQNHQLGASFFCSHRLPDCRDASLIIPTIAYQLARLSDPFRAALCRVLDKNLDVVTRAVSVQFEKLLSEPLLEVKGTMVEGKVVVVVEALDECADRVHVQQFIDALFRHASSLPVRFFITCRPTPGLYEKLQSQYASSRSVLRLHDIQEEVVQKDIEGYLTAELASVPNGTIKWLAELSGRLFIFAATVVGYVRPRGGSVRQKRLDAIANTTWGQGDGVYRPIDTLYTAILSAVFCDEESNDTEKAMTMQVLYTVICAREPLTTSALAALLDIGVDEVELALEPLLPVLHVSEDDSLVSTLHASFPDYMLNKERSEQYYCDPDVQHTHITWRCLEIMRALLRFNICDIETSYLLDEEVLDLQERIERSIPSHLAYACRYLGEHIRRARKEHSLASSCVEFVKTRMLYWMEVLNLFNCISAGIATLVEVQKWLQIDTWTAHADDLLTDITKHNSDDEIDGLLRDGQKFLNIVSLYHVSQSTPHLYISVLALWSRDDPMWRCYGTLSRRLPWSQEVVVGGNKFTGLTTPPMSGCSTDRAAETQGYFSSTTLRLFAPDGSRYAFKCASGIHVCEAHTGNILSGPYTNGRDRHNQLGSFYYNGKWIATISLKHEVTLWDTWAEGCPGHLPKLDTSTIEWLKLSPGDLLLAAQNDGYTSVWNLRTLTRQALIESYPLFLGPLAWSPDGDQLAAVDCSGRHCIWDTCTGRRLFKIGENIGPEPFGIAQYSHCGTRIALMLASELSVWDTQSGDKLIGSLATHYSLSSPVFTPDDRYIALCGTETGVWDHHTSEMVVGPFRVPWSYEWLWGSRTISFTSNGYLTYLTSDNRQFKWRLDSQGVAATPSIVRSWTIHKDGWVTGPNSQRLLWIMPDMFEHIGKTPIVMHDRGPFGIAWDTVMVGERWKECWIG